MMRRSNIEKLLEAEHKKFVKKIKKTRLDKDRNERLEFLWDDF